MIKTYKYQGKTEEDTIEQGLSELKVTKDQCFYQTNYEQGKLFKSGKYQVEILLKSDVEKFLKDYFNELAQKMNIEVNAIITCEDNNFNIELDTSVNNVLIGKEGKNLHALLTLVRQTVHAATPFGIKVSLDISGYRKRQFQVLENEVRKIAEEVAKTGIEAALDPMNSYERRFVHSIISTIKGICTKSVGEGRERHIIIEKEEN